MSKFATLPPEIYHSEGLDITLRLFRDDDADFLVHIATDSPVTRFVPWAKWVKDTDSALRQIAEFKSSYDSGIRVRYIVDSGGQPIGYAGMWADAQEDYYEFGFAVAPEFRGQKFGTRIVRTLKDMASKELVAKGMVAYVNDTNKPSKNTVIGEGFVPTDSFNEADRRYELQL